jgi:hypothetical protein
VRGLRRREVVRTMAFLVLSLAAAGCGAGVPAGAPEATEPQPPPARQSAPEPLYEADVTVLENKGRGPMLCFGFWLMSLPPQCGDVPIANWSWDEVAGETSQNGRTEGAYHVVGTYDGERFTVERVGPFQQGEEEPEGGNEPLCPAPPGGWAATPSAWNGGIAKSGAGRFVTAQPEYVASRTTALTDPSEAVDDLSIPVVWSVVVNGDAARIEKEIRSRWDGPLCVVERDFPTFREARRIRRAVEASLDELGLRLLALDDGDLSEAVRIQVVADPGGAGQAAMDERYGPGVVHVVPLLVPVE